MRTVNYSSTVAWLVGTEDVVVLGWQKFRLLTLIINLAKFRSDMILRRLTCYDALNQYSSLQAELAKMAGTNFVISMSVVPWTWVSTSDLMTVVFVCLFVF